ncbi:MAG: homoserine O-succinyltransferase [Bacteroidales bacterium]|nr:homoserine O-succinyltransferase [Bacteroidales bacterium]
MLFLPEKLPAAAQLRAEGYAVSEYPLSAEPASDVAGRRVLFLNLMPQKAVTELDIARTIAATGQDVTLLPMKIAGQTYKTTPQAHMDAFYRDFESFAGSHYDGLIVTGAPVEHLDFQDVRYWPELCHIMDWAREHVRTTLYICWGAQAALFHLYGIPKYALSAKRFGIFPQQVLDAGCPLLRGLSPTFPMPHSRHTEVRPDDFREGGVRIVADGAESGIGIAVGSKAGEVFVIGHLEYEPLTLDKEYRRDLAKGLPILPPAHYYVDDDPAKGVEHTWKSAAIRFYGNWLDSMA